VARSRAALPSVELAREARGARRESVPGPPRERWGPVAQGARRALRDAQSSKSSQGDLRPRNWSRRARRLQPFIFLKGSHRGLGNWRAPLARPDVRAPKARWVREGPPVRKGRKAGKDLEASPVPRAKRARKERKGREGLRVLKAKQHPGEATQTCPTAGADRARQCPRGNRVRKVEPGCEAKPARKAKPGQRAKRVPGAKQVHRAPKAAKGRGEKRALRVSGAKWACRVLKARQGPKASPVSGAKLAPKAK
jgi:hypothetical protein